MAIEEAQNLAFGSPAPGVAAPAGQKLTSPAVPKTEDDNTCRNIIIGVLAFLALVGIILGLLFGLGVIGNKGGSDLTPP